MTCCVDEDYAYKCNNQNCGIDEYCEPDLEMCKPCTEVCGHGHNNKSCTKYCPCYIVRMNLNELRRNYTESQTKNSELAAKNKERLTIVVVLSVFVVVFLLVIILLVIKMWRKPSEPNLKWLHPAEENNVKTRLTTSASARGPPSPDVVPEDGHQYFCMQDVGRENAAQRRDTAQQGESAQQEDTAQQGDSDQRTDPKHSCLEQDGSNRTARTYIAASSSVRDEAFFNDTTPVYYHN
ncbi:hypothetical protein LSAT2_003549 [Lamellibrachia satsuma]|nr:hypothetical protein LSAT2_003549 [Lamellibrachia satsuma]